MMVPTIPPRRARQMERKYGLTVAGFFKLWKRQGGACAICAKKFQQPRHAHVEHSHKPPKIVRGLACFYCNYRVIAPLDRAGKARTLRAVAYLGWGDA